MNSFLPHTDEEIRRMLKVIGVEHIEELFADIPKELRLKAVLNLPLGISESEAIQFFKQLAANAETTYFVGAGSYWHTVPSIIDSIISQGDFFTAYTPYQPEVSQGTLQAIFEYQSLICILTGLEVSNASMYDGASATAEAVLMANRASRKGKSRFIISRGLHPRYLSTIKTYCKHQAFELVEIPFNDEGTTDLIALESALDGNTCAVVLQSPNFCGCIEDSVKVGEICATRDVAFIYVTTEALSLAALKPPGQVGANICAGEGQSFGLGLNFGGPYLGILAASKEYLRKMPGRIVGKTKDMDGKTGYVLTLATREQHIRREKATSNICTNQALCALAATIFLASMGQAGLRELAYQNMQKAAYLRSELAGIKNLRFPHSAPFFNEFIVELPMDATEFIKRIHAIEHPMKILPGMAPSTLDSRYPKNWLLTCATEMNSREGIELLVKYIKSVIG